MVASAPASAGTKGVIRQVIGPVLDVEFPAGKLPKIYNALRIEAKNTSGQDVALTAEVQQLLGDHRVRAVAMSGTDGLVRGMEAHFGARRRSHPRPHLQRAWRAR